MKRFAAFLLAVILLSAQCFAAQLETDGVVNAVPGEVKEIVGGIDVVGNTEAFWGRITGAVKNAINDNIKSILKIAVSVLAIAVICSILTVFGNEKTPDYIHMCGCAAILLVCVSDVNSYISLGTDAINEISAFSNILLPTLCTATATCGAVGAATVKYAAAALFMDLIIAAAKNIILPFIYAYLALSCASAAFDNKPLGSIASLFKWICTSLMTILSLAFTAYISISSAIASSGDAVATKLAKTTISAALPVVGSIISDAASSVIAGAELIKNTIGVFGMLTVLAICASPLVIIGLNYLAFKAAAVGVAAMKTTKIAALTDSIGSAFGMLLGLVGCCGVIMFISILSCVRTVVG